MSDHETGRYLHMGRVVYVADPLPHEPTEDQIDDLIFDHFERDLIYTPSRPAPGDEN